MTFKRPDILSKHQFNIFIESQFIQSYLSGENRVAKSLVEMAADIVQAQGSSWNISIEKLTDAYRKSIAARKKAATRKTAKK